MTRAAQAAVKQDTLELPGRLHAVVGILAFLPMMVIALTVVGLILEPQPILLIGILTLVLGSCVMLSWQALSIILGGELEFMPEGLKVKRLFQEQIYPWGTLEYCKVMPATGTLGDDALAPPEDRVGVGLFVRGLDRAREHDLDADVVLCAGDRDNVQAMMRIAQRVQKAIERAEAYSKRRPSRAMPSAPQTGRALGKKRRAPQGMVRKAKPAGNVVSQFRNSGEQG